MTTVLQKQAAPFIEKKPIHFSGLNAFRFLAASMVVLVHIIDMASSNRLTTFSLPISGKLGGLAVTFFFVLSGFLITYLLLSEKDKYNTVAIKKFYLRRILRIWPLYYLILFLAFALLNNYALFPSIADRDVYQRAPANLLLYLGMLPNVAWVNKLQILYANQLWSVGVEEQFYLFWPLVIKFLNKRKQLYFMLALLGGYILLGNSIAFILSHFEHFHHDGLAVFSNLLAATRIDCMAIGGLGAYAYFFHAERTRRFISSRLVDAAVLLLVLFLSFSSVFIPYVMQEVFGMLFCYIILSSSCKTASILNLDGKVWKWLGTLSYGIYMWHMVVLGLLLFIIKSGFVGGGNYAHLFLLYVLSLPLTILVSWLSYNYIEKPFLRLKKAFVLVESSPS